MCGTSFDENFICERHQYNQKIYYKVSYKDREKAKKCGALYDKRKKKWYSMAIEVESFMDIFFNKY